MSKTSSTSGRAEWGVLELSVPAPRIDCVFGALGEGVLGVESCGEGRGGSVRLRVYFPSRAEAAGTREVLAGRLLADCGIDPDSTGLVDRPVPDERWAERYQAGLRPIPLGKKFRVVPGSVPDREGDRIVLRLTPGRAFGTGEHPTTRLCVEALEREVRPGSRWLDLGTGTGILALVAAHSGAERVYALDVDPDAVQVAKEVIRENGVAERVSVALGSCESLGKELVDGLVANIEAPFFVRSADELAARLRPGGVLLASGLLAGDETEVRKALSRSGLRTTERRQESGWLCLRAELATAVGEE